MVLYLANKNPMKKRIILQGLKGKKIQIDPDDKLAIKFAMLFEGHCLIGAKEAVKKYGYTEQRYYQLLKLFNKIGSQALIDKKRGSDKPRVRGNEVLSQIIRMRFLDPMANTDILTQKLNQLGYNVSKRSVERTITEYGLQKKLMSLTQRRKKKKSLSKFNSPDVNNG